jgi:putative tricarboxylic transport membrane protein
MEANLRRALILTRGSYPKVFLNSSITIVLTVIALASIMLPLARPFMKSVRVRKTY